MIRARILRAALVACALPLASSAAAGCAPETRGPCLEAYRHLLEIGRKNHDPDLERRFVDSCGEAWDAGQVACLMQAETPEQAVACRPTKTRPG